MTADKAFTLLATVSQSVLGAIQDMSGRQRIKKPICLDSVALVLKIKLTDLTPVIKHLESQGHVTIHPNPVQRARVLKPDSVSLN